MLTETLLPDETVELAASIPLRIREGFYEYAALHRQPGSFLLSVLRNDLTEAVCRADPESLRHIREIVQFAYNCLPDRCWGSAEKVAAWLAVEESKKRGN